MPSVQNISTKVEVRKYVYTNYSDGTSYFSTDLNNAAAFNDLERDISAVNNDDILIEIIGSASSAFFSLATIKPHSFLQKASARNQ